MKTEQNSSTRASALQITLISLSAALLTFAAAPQIPQKPAVASIALQGAHGRATVLEPSVAPKRKTLQKSARVEFASSRQRVGGREVAGFSAPQVQTAQEENLIPPAGLKPVEQEAWLARARQQDASGGVELVSCYPDGHDEP